jgi:transposase
LRIVAADEADETHEEIAQSLLVGVATVGRVLRLYRETGDVTPGKTTGRRRRLSDDDLAVLRELVLEKPDRLLHELMAELERKTGKVIGQATMSRSLARLNLTRKKSGSTPRK